MINIWVDDEREAPEGYLHFHAVNDVIYWIKQFINNRVKIGVLDLDHDAGIFAKYGGDYINILDWLAANGYDIPIHIHSMNPVGRENMMRVCRRNNWTVI